MLARHPRTWNLVSKCSSTYDEIVYLLNESIAATASCVVFLELHKLERTKWLEDILKILLSDAKVDVADIQTVEWDRVRVSTSRFRGADLAILLSFGKLDDDGNT